MIFFNFQDTYHSNLAFTHKFQYQSKIHLKININYSHKKSDISRKKHLNLIQVNII
jgi:hypothetical protein